MKTYENRSQFLTESYIPFRFVNLNIWKFFKEFAPTFFAAVIMGILILLLRHYIIISNHSDWFILIVCTVTGAVVYSLLLGILKRGIFHEIISYIKIATSRE